MSIRDMALAALASMIWGVAFVAVKFALESFSAPQLTVIRFLIACVPVVLVPRPRLSWPLLVLVGLTLFTGQFMLLFFAYTQGLPPGLASVAVQMHVFFTVLLAAAFLDDIPNRQQSVGVAIAFAGLALIGSTATGDLPPRALGLALAGAFSWAIGNVLVKRAADVPMLPLVVWASLVPPVPALLVSGLFEHGPSLVDALRNASWRSIAAALYLGIAATVVAYAVWGRLLQRYPAAMVAPFALLAPCTGIVSSALVFREVFSPMRYAGMGLILCGLAVVVLPAGLRRSGPGGPRAARTRDGSRARIGRRERDTDEPR